SVIKLNAQALSKNLYKDEERRMQAAVTINDKVDEIEKYVTDIVSASREEFLDLSVKEEDFYLADVIDRLRDTYENKTSLHKTKLEIQEYKNCLLKGDEDRILEVLQNIMENALKYGDGERITISFERDQGCCLIMVSNTGEGMMAEEIMKVFDSFYRGSNVQNKPGSGLGLYICRQLMTNMNGDIFVNQKENEFKVTVVVRMC
ncbi:MAG: sensor histidine kinase, partial [Lachnospiraceae bacterium]